MRSSLEATTPIALNFWRRAQKTGPIQPSLERKSTIYPILSKLESKGFIQSTDTFPKNYSLTDKGIEQINFLASIFNNEIQFFEKFAQTVSGHQYFPDLTNINKIFYERLEQYYDFLKKELERVEKILKSKKFVFSSSAAVYGEPKEIPISETHPCAPANPYGETKWIFERVLQAFYEYNIVPLALLYQNINWHCLKRHPFYRGDLICRNTDYCFCTSLSMTPGVLSWRINGKVGLRDMFDSRNFVTPQREFADEIFSCRSLSRFLCSNYRHSFNSHSAFTFISSLL
jgi:hypothetical protein